jgi:hypothetical protein
MKTRYSECAKPRAAQGVGPRRYRILPAMRKPVWPHQHWPIEAQQSDRLRTSAIQHQPPFARKKRLQSSREARASDTYRIASVMRISNESGSIAVTQLSRLVTRTRFKRTRSDVFGCPAPSNSRLQGMSFYS